MSTSAQIRWTNRAGTNQLQKAIRNDSRKLSAEQIEDLSRRFCAIIRAFADTRRKPNGRRRVSDAAAALIAQSLVTGRPLSCVTYECLPDHKGARLEHTVNHGYSLTEGEKTMFSFACFLKEQCEQNGVTLVWRLILGDVYGTLVYGPGMQSDTERELEQNVDEIYCNSMLGAYSQQKIASVCRWSDLLGNHPLCRSFEDAGNRLVERIGRDKFNQLIASACAKGEVKDYFRRPQKEVAQRLISFRAAEGAALVDILGPTIVLSTEQRQHTCFDHLLVSPDLYPILYNMPYRPHLA